jgi:ATP-dependent DNA ligase
MLSSWVNMPENLRAFSSGSRSPKFLPDRNLFLDIDASRSLFFVAQFEFAEWTPDGHLRHSKFVGLRADKDAREVGREN